MLRHVSTPVARIQCSRVICTPVCIAQQLVAVGADAVAADSLTCLPGLGAAELESADAGKPNVVAGCQQWVGCNQIGCMLSYHAAELKVTCATATLLKS